MFMLKLKNNLCYDEQFTSMIMCHRKTLLGTVTGACQVWSTLVLISSSAYWRMDGQSSSISFTNIHLVLCKLLTKIILYGIMNKVFSKH